MSAGFEFVITRTFDAPRSLVWKAWTEPERLKQWWSPVRDLETASKLYEGTLGLKRVGAVGEELIIFRSGKSSLNVYRSRHAGTNQATVKGVAFRALRPAGPRRQHPQHRQPLTDKPASVKGKP